VLLTDHASWERRSGSPGHGGVDADPAWMSRGPTFERLANDALASARTDPEIAGHLAAQAVALVEGPVLRDFEYEEWASPPGGRSTTG
jgi:hypothetical protein